jgi:hypothetical protein
MSIEQERLLSLVEFAQQSARLRTTPASTITQHGVFALYERRWCMCRRSRKTA